MKQFNIRNRINDHSIKIALTVEGGLLCFLKAVYYPSSTPQVALIDLQIKKITNFLTLVILENLFQPEMLCSSWCLFKAPCSQTPSLLIGQWGQSYGLTPKHGRIFTGKKSGLNTNSTVTLGLECGDLMMQPYCSVPC